MPLKIFGKQAQKNPAEEVSPHTFLCLMFVNQSVQAALWKVEGEDITTLSQSSLISFEDEEDGLIKADQALQELGSDSENINQVIFGFDPLWVNESGLIKEKKAFIKSVTENLSLNPVGFVVITDALVQHVLTKDSLASEVLVYMQEDTVFIFLLKQGKLVDQLSVGRSGDIVQDIVEGLARFAKQLTGGDAHLPAKLRLASPVLSSPEIDDAQQQIANYNWSDNHPFVQTPMVESMLALDVLYAVVEQGGIAVAQAKGLKGKEARQDGEEKMGAGAEDFGFENIDSPLEGGDNFATPDKEYATSFGVPITEDKLPEAPATGTKSDAATRHSKKKRQLPKFFKKLQQWYSHHPHKKIILGGVGGGVVALIALFIGWLALAHQLEISVRLAEKVITKDVEILIDPTVSASNPQQQILKADLETAAAEGSETVDTTGVTLVGERATGTVTLFNKTDAEKTFGAGTTLSTGTISFTLDEEVTVASASSEESGGQLVTDYGKADAAVTAKDIGAEGNIAEGTELTVDSFADSTYSAAAKETLSGGSSREVRVVSEEDHENVLQTLQDILREDVAEQFADKSGDGTYYAPTTLVKIIEENYDVAVGDEADQLTLDLVVEISVVKYQSEDLRPLLEEALKDDIPEGYQLIDEEPEVLSSPKEDEATASTKVSLDANVRAKARPPFDSQNVIDSILGLSIEEMTNRLVERPEIEQASHSFKPGIAGIFAAKVPQNAERVIVTITNQEE